MKAEARRTRRVCKGLRRKGKEEQDQGGKKDRTAGDGKERMKVEGSKERMEGERKESRRVKKERCDGRRWKRKEEG